MRLDPSVPSTVAESVATPDSGSVATADTSTTPETTVASARGADRRTSGGLGSAGVKPPSQLGNTGLSEHCNRESSARTSRGSVAANSAVARTSSTAVCSSVRNVSGPSR